jgi:hypothetical protein
MAELTLSWSPNGEEHLGILDATVSSGDFSGHGYAWFDRRQIRDTFIAALRAYPLSVDRPPRIEGSHRIIATPNGEEPIGLGIMIVPYKSRGALLVRVDLASETRTNPDKNMLHTITVRFVVQYEALGKFSTDLEAALYGKKERAVLRSATQ